MDHPRFERRWLFICFGLCRASHKSLKRIRNTEGKEFLKYLDFLRSMRLSKCSFCIQVFYQAFAQNSVIERWSSVDNVCSSACGSAQAPTCIPIQRKFFL